MLRFTFDEERALEALLYVVERGCTNLYHALKVLYFADKEHLGQYGRFITGDRYIAMAKGPVPSAVYDMVKWVRGDGCVAVSSRVESALSVRGRVTLHALRGAELDALSESDVECLDSAIAHYSHLPHGTLMDASHDPAFKSTKRNAEIPLELIARELPDGEEVLAYLLDS